MSQNFGPLFQSDVSSLTVTVVEPTSYTPTFVGLGSVTNVNCYYNRIGPIMHLYLNFNTGTTTATPPLISLPNSLVPNTTLITMITSVGFGAYFNGSGGIAITALAQSNSNNLTINPIATVNPLVLNNANVTFTSSQPISISAAIPIQGWT